MSTEESVSIPSAGLRLSGVVHTPADIKPGEKRAAFLVLHGFGSNKDSENVLRPCETLDSFGYVTLRFDMPGCGKSEGEKGRVICLEQVQATSDALTFLQSHPHVDPKRIAVVGTSFGGAVAAYTGGIDKRVAAVISNGGWGNGERKFKGQHPGDAWPKFLAMLEKGKQHREETGQSLMVPRYDIVPIPKHVRDKLEKEGVTAFPTGSIEMFPAETAQSMYEFTADNVVGDIAPRPFLLIHSANDSVTPTEQSVEMFKRAGQPAELHLFSGVDHFLFAENSARVWGVMQDWLDKYFPAKA